MSVAKCFALAVMVSGTLLALTPTGASAQACPGNPSGGTSLRQTVEEGSGTFSPEFSFFRGLPVNPALQGWFSTFAASRAATANVSRPVDSRSLLTIARRANGRR